MQSTTYPKLAWHMATSGKWLCSLYMVEIEVPERTLKQSPSINIFVYYYFHVHCIEIELVAKQRGELIYLKLLLLYMCAIDK